MLVSKTQMLILAALAISMFLPAYSLADPGEEDGARVIAVVNGEELTQADFITFVRSRLGDNYRQVELNQQQLNTLLSEYINRELLYQDAVKKGWDKAPDVSIALDNQRRNIVASYALRQLINSPITEEELEHAYKTQMAKPVREYRTKHILVDSEARAREVIDALEQGTPFGKLAKEASVDASADAGGELGWVSDEQLSKPLRRAMLDLKKGAHSKQPIKSEFGWHIIRLEDTRILPPPPYEEVRDELRKRLHNQNVSDHLSQLLSNSEIEFK